MLDIDKIRPILSLIAAAIAVYHQYKGEYAEATFFLVLSYGSRTPLIPPSENNNVNL